MLLTELFETGGKPELIAEEALRLPTTVGARFATKFEIPWADVDMDHYQRNANGIDEEVPTWPLFNGSGDFAGTGQRYVKEIQGVREDYWYRQLVKHGCNKIWLICGSIHLIPLARKLRSHQHDVVEVRTWEMEWYRKTVGKFVILEDGEEWTSEFFGINAC